MQATTVMRRACFNFLYVEASARLGQLRFFPDMEGKPRRLWDQTTTRRAENTGGQNSACSSVTDRVDERSEQSHAPRKRAILLSYFL